MTFRTKFLLFVSICVPPNNPITACGATSFPDYHSFPKWAIICGGLHFWRHLDVIDSIIFGGLHFWCHWFNMAKILSKFGEQQLVMVNYACGFNQSETGKYFEWIIKTIVTPRAFNSRGSNLHTASENKIIESVSHFSFIASKRLYHGNFESFPALEFLWKQLLLPRLWNLMYSMQTRREKHQ